MRKNNKYILSAGLFFSGFVMAAGSGTLAPTVVPMVNGGQASIAVSNTSPNLFTIPGDRITAVSRYTRSNGREPSGAAGLCLQVMMSLSVLAEFCAGLVLVWLCLHPDTGAILSPVSLLMSITALILAVSLGLKFGR